MLADKLVQYTNDYDLSDIHIRANQPIAIRVNGEIMVFENDIITKAELEEFWKSVLTKKQLIEIVNDRDLDFATVVEPYRYRANGYYTSYGPSMVLRKIVSDIPDMSKLGLPAAVNDAIKHKSGLVLVTGQTGSGKSTSLAAMIDQINTHRSENIITIEDPIEFVHKAKKKYYLPKGSWKRYRKFCKSIKICIKTRSGCNSSW